MDTFLKELEGNEDFLLDLIQVGGGDELEGGDEQQLLGNSKTGNMRRQTSLQCG